MQPNQNKNRPEQDNEDQTPQRGPNWNLRFIPVVLLVFLVLWVLIENTGVGSGSELSYSELRDNYTAIETITFSSDGNSLNGTFREGTNITEDSGFASRATSFQQETLSELIDNYNQCIRVASGNGAVGTASCDETINYASAQTINIEVAQSQGLMWAILFNALPFLLIVGIIIFMMRRAQGQVNGVFNFGQSRAKEYDAQMPRITFDDVAGQDGAKRELVEVVDFLKEPEKYISLGARIPRGVLLVGPPGTGKTLMARAVAGEANVAFYSISASEFVEMFVGVGASRVRDLFNKAKENSPSIVFIDEIDAVGRQRGAGMGGGNDEREQTLNQMLSELDGFEQSATVIVMAATNRPDVLDPALLRPGRFDRQVTVDLPDRKGRLAILKIHTRGKPLAKDVEIETMANATIGFSGADLANLANEAALHAARYNRKKITQADFSNAFERIILGIERPPLSDLRARRITAYHEAGHAVTALLTPGADQVLKVTITPRGFAGGITAFIKDENRGMKPQEYYESEIKVGLGGRVAESIIFGEITAGAAGDIRQVSQIARRMVTQWGMSSLGMVDYSNGGNQPFLGYSLSQGRTYSEETAAKIDAEVRGLIDGAYDYTYTLLSENQDKLDTVANALLEREVLEREELLNLLDMNPDKPMDEPEDAMVEDSDDVVVTVTDTTDDPFALFTDDSDDNDGETPSDTITPPETPDSGDHPEQNQ